MINCKLALQLNGQLVGPDQTEYQLALESTYAELLASLENVLGCKILPDSGAGIVSSAPCLSLLADVFSKE